MKLTSCHVIVSRLFTSPNSPLPDYHVTISWLDLPLPGAVVRGTDIRSKYTRDRDTGAVILAWTPAAPDSGSTRLT